MTASWLYSRIAETGFYDELQLRIAAKHHDRDNLMQAFFDGLPWWWKDTIRSEWDKMQMMEEAE